MFLILLFLNFHATLGYCVQSHGKLSVTIYHNKIVVFEVALTDTQAKIPFAFYLDSTNLGIGVLLRSSAVTSVTC